MVLVAKVFTRHGAAVSRSGWCWDARVAPNRDTERAVTSRSAWASNAGDRCVEFAD
ncbi:hypothetical protein GCM10022255_003950 [Dactylosporangium darangshiense]|uniref:DUF397 domain-containing protein n=1 Tax=Dactylosporangium darangshiense TaxID=579108 RepID=A0ABP8CV48_9ACTN